MVTAIIAAAGSGSRMGKGVNKVFLSLHSKPILLHSIELFINISEIKELIIVTSPSDTVYVSQLVAEMDIHKPVKIVPGGSERQYSIANALCEVDRQSEVIIVHDGARPLVEEQVVLAVIEAARKYRAAGVAVPVKDTIKVADDQGFVVSTPDRKMLWAIQTPQAFEAALLKEAYFFAGQQNFLGTDDASLVERMGVSVKLVQGNYRNIKITTPEDLQFAEALSGKKGEGAVRVGIGYDVHRLIEGRRLVLGGEEIPHTHGLDGHSDADVLLHAIKDALLGAAALGDIGKHFPDTDQQYKGISSLTLLVKVREILKEHGYVVNNVDATIVAEKPKLAPYIDVMNKNIAEALEVPAGKINVKATTTEGLGFAGKREGIAAYATVSILEITGA